MIREGTVLGARATTGIKTNKTPFSRLGPGRNNLIERDDLLMQRTEN